MDASLILRGARIALGPDEAVVSDIAIAGRRIQAIGNIPKSPKSSVTLDLSGHLIMPGLINAHDHLEFNLYPRLGRGPYPNAGAWARDIYRPNDSPVREQLQIPKNTRLFWGGLKNLLSGVTTVCHHNPRDARVFDRNFPVRVVRQFGWAHSLEFSSDLVQRFHATPPGWPFILHLGEGVDRSAQREIFQLDELGALDGRTVLVHAVALGAAGLRLAKERRASFIWCPSSNLFLFGRTLGERSLSSGVPVALGSDSALTAEGDLLDEIQVARKVSGMSSTAIYRMVTTEAARVLRLKNGSGALTTGSVADLIALPDVRRSPASALSHTNGPALAIVGGKVKLVAPSLATRLLKSRLHPIRVEGRGDFLVDANVPKLIERAGRELRLAGRRILA
jgi:cytosine/adenosine deaminase-related metal-dependent hydrolase